MSKGAAASTERRQALSTLRSKRYAFVVFALLPFHVVAMYLVASNLDFEINDISFIALKMWKEVAVVTAVFLAALTAPRIYKRPLVALDWWIVGFVLLGGVYAILGERIVLAAWSFRTLFGLFLFYAFGRIQRFTLDDFQRFLRMMVVIAVLTSLFSVYQVEVLGTEFHTMVLGLDEAPAQLQSLEYERIRATSTFVSVHEFGLFLVFALFAFPFVFGQRSAVARFPLGMLIMGFVILVGLVYSFSRSSIAILMLGMLFFGLRRTRDFFVMGMFGILILIMLDSMGMMANIQAVTGGVDPSTSGHLILAQQALGLASQNPMGIGLGSVGVIARRFDPSAPQFEGEWFNILVQMGLLGGLVALLLWWRIFRRAVHNARSRLLTQSERNLSLYVALLVLGTAVRELVLPRDQMNSSLAWFVIGAYTSYMTYRSSPSTPHQLEAGDVHKGAQ